MTDLDACFDDLEPFFELQTPASLISNELGLSNLNLTSKPSFYEQKFVFEGEILEGSPVHGEALACALKLVGPAVSFGVNRFLCYADIQPTGILSVGDVVNREFPFDKKMIPCLNGELNERELRQGLSVEFKPRLSESLSQSLVHIFQIQARGTLLCCATFGKTQTQSHGVKEETLSDAIDSLCDSDSLDQITSFDIDELDNYNTIPTNNFSDSLSRKRSFLNREDVATSASTSYHTQEDLYINSFSQPKGLKKLKSARNLQRDLLEQRQAQNQVKMSELISRSSAFSTVSSLSRCASAPAMKLNARLKQGAQEKQQINAVYQLLTDISNNSDNRFVGVITKFILSEKETLTKLIQKELCFCSRPKKLFTIFYEFLNKNFPPFQLYCSNVKNYNESEVEKCLNKLNEQQFDDISIDINDFNSIDNTEVNFHSLKGPWKVVNERKKNILEFYKKLGFSEPIAACYTAIDSGQTIRYDEMTNAFVIDKEEKLFSQSKQRFVADGTERKWKICSPLLQEDHNFSTYCCKSTPESSTLVIDKVVIGNKVKMSETFEVGENGQLECSYCLYKADVKPDEKWTLVYSTLVLYDKI